MSEDHPADAIDAGQAASKGGDGSSANPEESRFSFGRGDVLVAAIGLIALALLVVLVVM